MSPLGDLGVQESVISDQWSVIGDEVIGDEVIGDGVIFDGVIFDWQLVNCSTRMCFPFVAPFPEFRFFNQGLKYN